MTMVINAAGINGSRIDDTQADKINKEGKKDNSGRIYAGNLNLAADPIEQKRKEAQKKALKVVQDAWENDMMIDEGLDARRKNIEKLREEEIAANDNLRDVESRKEALKEQYGIIEDSDEYRDLQLLERRQNSEAKLEEPLTKEELEKLEEIDAKPLTEFQKRSLELNEAAVVYKVAINDAKQQAMDEIANIQNIQFERLKTHPMVDASKAAASILEAANKEIIGMLINEAKDNIDEQMEENEKKAEENAEKQEEKEERLEDIKEQKKWQEAIIEGTKEAVEQAEEEERRNEAPDIDIDIMISLVKNNKQSDSTKQSLEEIKSSMRLVEADLKGIEVDVEV